jgi:hypothetical protein
MNGIKKNYNILRKSNIALGVFLSILVILFYIVYSAPYWNNNINWQDINVNNMQLTKNGPKYSLIDGYIISDNGKKKIKFEINPIVLYRNSRLLQLAMFRASEEESPLFVDSNFGDQSFQDSVANLNRVNKILQEELEIDTTGLPIGFLGSLDKLSKTKKDFKNEVNLDNANKIINAYKNTNNEYLSDSKALLGLINKSDLKSSYFAQGGAVTSKNIIASDIRLIIKNSAENRKKYVSRQACLNISLAFCKRDILNFEAKNITPHPNNIKAKSIISPDDYPSIKDTDKLAFKGPYLIESNCWLDSTKDNSHLLYLVEDTTTGLTKVRPEFADRVYYQKITLENRGPFLYKQFQKKNMEWEMVILNSPYACNDLRYYGEISTVDNFYKKYPEPLIYNSDEFSKDEFGNPLIMGIYNAEKDFYTSEYLSNVSLNILSEKYKEYYVDCIKNHKNFNPLLSKEGLIRRINLIDSKLSYYPEILNYQIYLLDMYSQTNGQRLRESVADKPGYDSYFYLMHNFYSLSFLSHSPHTYPKNDLKYIDINSSIIRSDIVNMEDIKKILSPEQINKINSINRNRIVNEVSKYEIK